MLDMILFPTIPGTGTHCAMGLLGFHTKIRMVPMDGEYPISPLIGFLNKGIITRERLSYLCYYTSFFKNHDPARMTVFAWTMENCQFLQETAIVSPVKYVVVYSHIFPTMYHGKFWVSDLVEGLSPKIILPLRDPVQVMASIVIKGVLDSTLRDETLHVVSWGFSTIASWFKKGKPIYYVPVDLLSKLESSRRIEVLKDLYSDFLDLEYEQGIIEYVSKWRISNPTSRNISMEGLTPEQYLDVQYGLDVKNLLDRGRTPGNAGLLNEYIQQFQANEDLKDLYKSAGYKDLCWF